MYAPESTADDCRLADALNKERLAIDKCNFYPLSNGQSFGVDSSNHGRRESIVCHDDPLSAALEKSRIEA